MRYLGAFGRFWWDFLVGDDWRIAAGVVGVLAIGALGVRTGALPDWSIAVGVGLALAVVAAACIVLPAHAAARAATRGAGSGPG